MSTATPRPLRIVHYPDPVLNEDCRALGDAEIAAGSADGLDLAELVAGMQAAMYEAEGIGLAAPQVGVKLRLFVIDISKGRDQPMTLLNPVLADPEGESEEEEGCLSIPGVRAKVKRARKLTVSAKDLAGAEIRFEAEDLLARVCQHENDHLDGILFIQRIGPAARFMLRRKLRELEEEYKFLQRRSRNRGH